MPSSGESRDPGTRESEVSPNATFPSGRHWIIRKPMSGHVYILASRKHGTIYIGVSSDLPKRIYEHRIGAVRGFTRRYGIKRIVYVETFDDIEAAITREKRMKEWQRDWKIQLIEGENPDWNDLAVCLLGFEPLPSPSTPHRHPGESRDPRTRKYPMK